MRSVGIAMVRFSFILKVKCKMQSLLLVSQMPISDVAVDLTYCAWRNGPLLGLNYSS